jgi:hypothetical protein
MSGKYAAAREDGLKPFVWESYHFGYASGEIVYAETAADAMNMYQRRYETMRYETIRVRRATPADIEEIRAERLRRRLPAS